MAQSPLSDADQIRDRMRIEIEGRDKTIADLEERVDYLNRERSQLAEWGIMVADLDRSEWGRHEGDVESQTEGGVSLGNPYLPPGTVLGFDLTGRVYVVPAREDRRDPKAWVQPRPAGKPMRRTEDGRTRVIWLEEGEAVAECDR